MATVKYLDGIRKLSRRLHMTGHGLALVLVSEALVGVAHVLGASLQGKHLLPSQALLLAAPLLAWAEHRSQVRRLHVPVPIPCLVEGAKDDGNDGQNGHHPAHGLHPGREGVDLLRVGGRGGAGGRGGGGPRSSARSGNGQGGGGGG